MYTNESLHKAVVNLIDATHAYQNEIIDGKSLTLCISKGNRKIGRVLNVSTAPVLTCGGNCSACMWHCYDIKAVLQYKNVLDARSRNTALAWENRDSYFNQIRQALSRRRTNKLFRWHVAGDIIDAAYFAEMVAIAREFPDFRFWTYTKQYSIVNAWIAENGKESLPANLSIMYSPWEGTVFQNPYGMPEFRVVMKTDDEQTAAEKRKHWHCPGNCEICTTANRGCVAKETSWVDEH